MNHEKTYINITIPPEVDAEGLAEKIAKMLMPGNGLCTGGIDIQSGGHVKTIHGLNNAYPQETVDSYQYPNAKRFHHIAKLAEKIAVHIENHNGAMPYDNNMEDIKMLQKYIDFMNDRGFIELCSTKVVQGLSISELLRMGTNPTD